MNHCSTIRCWQGAAALLLAAAAGRPCMAIWAYVPQEVRMAEASLVVMGKIAEITEDVVKDGTVYEVGIIEPVKVLKGKAPEQIRLAWPKPNPGGLALSTQLPTPRVGERSIWVLSADEKLPVYWASYPTDRQPVDSLKDVEKRLETVNKLTWSEPVGGLQLAVFIEARDVRRATVRIQGKPVEALEQLSCYTLMRNAGGQPLHLVDYPYDNPFAIEFTDPSGQPIEVQTSIAAPRKPPIAQRNFLAAAPGQVRSIGYGFQLGTVSKPGEYTVTLRYKSAQDGKAFGFDDVWQGELATAPLKVKVAK